MRKNNLIIAKIIFVEFNHCKNYNTKKFKIFMKVGVVMGIIGRPKAEISHSKAIIVRLTNFAFKKIFKTETIVHCNSNDD